MTKAPAKVVAITGASSGIGEATARRLAGDGHHVFLGARRTGRLAALVREITAQGGSAAFRALDVTSRADVRGFVAAARERFGRLDVMVNNAGVMPLSPLAALRVDEWDRTVDVNVRGVLHGIAAALPVMRAQDGGGHVVNIASVGAYEVSPTAAVYCASKFAVRAISEGLRQECGDGRIRVTLVSPGVTESELADSIGDPTAREAMKAYRAVALPAAAVADGIAYAVSRPAGVDVNELVIRPAASAQ
ncbi:MULTISPECIES: SDR family oxidoreductase [Streptomyces]|uniref:SDR family oxidoreductase n=1 Tax=Streptomyces TaxID=1883 RepID=UPI000F7892F8|nr:MULTISPECIES: SDR family oxidoreductase [Streptomyces]RST08858.1 SDR family oxidoreductase [Streptomyces sp. WAC07149]GLX19672.1 oxidoreductase [Streptomyces lavendulae subsp. lavendulae]GLX27167.1 oxidoreductase [Streptomyces lavendulae subsp. lavendulae]